MEVATAFDGYCITAMQMYGSLCS